MMRLGELLLATLILVFVALTQSCTTLPVGRVETNGSVERHRVASGGEVLETGIEYPVEGTNIQGMVVFVRGSGGGYMWDYFPGFMDTYLRSVFLEEGYAIVVSNKRGIGESTGTWQQTSSFLSMGDDVLNIIEYYKTLNPKLGHNVGLVGHSQGGWILQRIAHSRNGIDFAVSLVSPIRTLGEQDLFRHGNLLACNGYSPDQIEKGLIKREKTHNLWRNLGGWFPYFELGFMHNTVDADASDLIKEIDIPYLFVYGGSDGLVSLIENVARLNKLFPDGMPNNLSVIADPIADHYLTEHDRMCNDYLTIPERRFSTTIYEGYRDWLRNNVFLL